MDYNLELEQIKLTIKAYWHKLFRTCLLYLGIFLIIFFVYNLKEQKYKKEYESATWYEVEAIYSHSFKYQNREEIDGAYEYVDYYDLYYNYVAKDGNTYEYVDKKNSVEQTTNIEIYVDENNPAHTLEKIEDDQKIILFSIKIAILIIFTPIVMSYLMTFIILYIKKIIIKQKIKKESEL